MKPLTEAANPIIAHLQRIRLIAFGIDVSDRYTKGQLNPLTAAFAYYWVFAIPPLLLLIVMIGVLLNAFTQIPVIERLRDLIVKHAPADSQDLLIRLVDATINHVSDSQARLGIVVAACIALWSVSGAVGILIVGFNRAYAVAETRPFVWKKLRTLILALALVLLVNITLVLTIFGERVGRWLADLIDRGDGFTDLWEKARWPIAAFAVWLAIASLYWAGPNVRQPVRSILVGSISATVSWLVLIRAFGLYAEIADPGSAYGAIGSVIMLLIFLKLTGMVFFLGAVINGILFQRGGHVPDATTEPAMVAVNE